MSSSKFIKTSDNYNFYNDHSLSSRQESEIIKDYISFNKTLQNRSNELIIKKQNKFSILEYINISNKNNNYEHDNSNTFRTDGYIKIKIKLRRKNILNSLRNYLMIKYFLLDKKKLTDCEWV